MRRVYTTFLAAVALGFAAAPAMSQGHAERTDQRARHGDRLSPADAQMSWEIQATTVAAHLELSAASTKELTAVYVANRQDHADILASARQERRGDKNVDGQKKRGERRAGKHERRAEGDGDLTDDRGARRGERGRRGMRVNVEQLQAAQDTLAVSLATILTPETLPIAMESLGTFSRAWDKQVHVISQLALNEADTTAVLDALLQHTVSVGKARQAEDADDPRQAVRQAHREMMAQLQDVLDEEQMEAFRSTMRRRAHRGPGAVRRGDRESI